MSNYTSQDDLIERYGTDLLLDLTDRADPPAGTIDAGVVQRALDDTDAGIDGYLLGRYVLPLAATPPLLRDLAQSIAIYKLHRDTASDKINNDYASAMKTLALISSGTVRLNVAGVEPVASDATGVQASDRQPSITSRNLRGYI
jgi:phage gp36-like protein